MQKNKKTYTNEQLSQITAGLGRYFPHLWDVIGAKNVSRDAGNKREWQTEGKFSLDSVTLLRRFLSESELVGVRFKTCNGKTNYLMADIDAGGRYHPQQNPAALEMLKHAIEGMGLANQIVIQSSDSKGLHVYIALSKPMDVFTAACWFEKSLRNAGFEISAGNLELFPNTKHWKKGKPSLYRAHNLPLQPASGSYLLDDDLEPVSDNILDFIQAMDFAAKHKNIVTDEMMLEAIAAKEAIATERKVFFGNGKINSSKIKEWKEDLEYYPVVGWTGSSETNNLLIKFGAYGVVFLGLEGEELTKHIVETARNATGYKEHCKHKHEIETRGREVARSTGKYYWKLGDVAKRSCTYRTMTGETVIANGNNAKTLNAMERLEAALKHIQEQVTHLESTTKNSFIELINETSKKLFKVGIGKGTLYKKNYAPRWQAVMAALVAAHVAISAPAVAHEETDEKPTPQVTQKTTAEMAQTPVNTGQFSPFQEKPEPEPPEPAQTLDSSDLSNEVFVWESSPLPEEENINKTYGQKPANDPPLTDNHSLSIKPHQPTEAEQSYYRILMRRHPHLKAEQEQRETSEYRTKARATFERIRGILGGVTAQSRDRDAPDSSNKT